MNEDDSKVQCQCMGVAKELLVVPHSSASHFPPPPPHSRANHHDHQLRHEVLHQVHQVYPILHQIVHLQAVSRMQCHCHLSDCNIRLRVTSRFILAPSVTFRGWQAVAKLLKHTKNNNKQKLVFLCRKLVPGTMILSARAGRSGRGVSPSGDGGRGKEGGGSCCSSPVSVGG